ncbi:DUF3761 domain-containing protein [Brevundimonas vesicularis]|uniref:DUF3761 domain-containing protein n=1 Tax=Brevundimonas vesicularis TaxID=41276 RepID=UPI003B435E83
MLATSWGGLVQLQVFLACLALSASVYAVPAEAQSCGFGYYRNTAGSCVPSPRRPHSGTARGLLSGSSIPSGETARCRDRTYSYSQSRRGTCSGHGGVAKWL